MRAFIFVLLLTSSLFGVDFAQRIEDHWKIRDFASAVGETQAAVKRSPDEVRLHHLYIKSLAKAGQEEELLRAWHLYRVRFPEAPLDHGLMEELSWGVLRSGCLSSSILTRLTALIGVALTRDARAIALLKERMADSSSFVRALAVQLAPLLGDAPLREEIVRLLREEKVFEVRLQVLRAIGQLKMHELIPELMRLLTERSTTPEEREEIIQALVQMQERLGGAELRQLTTSAKKELRMLACEVLLYCDLVSEAALLAPLLQDSQYEVQARALKALGLLELPQELRARLRPQVAILSRSPNPLVGVTASWCLLLFSPRDGVSAFQPWLAHALPDVRALAAAALGAAGEHGIALSATLVRESTDPFVRANCAIGLIGQRVNVAAAAEELYAFFETSKEQWMHQSFLGGLFSPLTKSHVSHQPAIPNYPEVVNQTVRLEVLNLLALLHHPKAQEAVARFLREKTFGIPILATETLLGEGDEEALALVRSLLTAEEEGLRLQAALVLAVWGRDRSALPVLQEIYAKTDRTMKIQILEAISRIKEAEMVPFLLEVIQDPSQVLRIIAASAVIQSICC